MEKNNGSIRELWTVTYPLVISTASYTFMMFMGRVFLSWQSQDAIAASAPGGILSFTIACFFMGIATFTNVLVSQFYGANNRLHLAASVWQGVWLSLFSGVLIIALTPFGEYIIRNSGHPDSIKTLELIYFRTLNMAGVLIPLTHSLGSFFTGRGKTKVTMIVNLIGNLINIVASYFCIFGFTISTFKFPAYGIKGAAFGMILGNLVIVCAYLAIFLNKDNAHKYKTRSSYKFNKELFWKLIKYGVPSGFSILLDVSAFSVFIFFVGDIGATALATNNIILSIEMISFMPVLGVGIATSTLVGQYIGRNDYESAKNITWSAIKLAVGYVLCLGTLFVFLPEMFIKIFNPGIRNGNEFLAVFELSKTLMRILVAFILFDSFNTIFAAAIKGAGDTKFQMISSVIIAYFIFIPGEYYILKVKAYPIQVAWIYSSFYLLLLAIVFFWRFKSDIWQNIKLLDNN